MEIYEHLTKNKKIPLEVFREYIEPMTRRKLQKEIADLILDPYKEWEITRLNREARRRGLKVRAIRIIHHYPTNAEADPV